MDLLGHFWQVSDLDSPFSRIRPISVFFIPGIYQGTRYHVYASSFYRITELNVCRTLGCTRGHSIRLHERPAVPRFRRFSPGYPLIGALLPRRASSRSADRTSAGGGLACARLISESAGPIPSMAPP